MANPQKEDGNVGIANEIFDMLCRTRIPGEARQIFDVILRKTYGFMKKDDWISLSQFCLMTGLKKPDVSRGLKKLFLMNLIIRLDNGNYAINKNFDLWKPLPKQTPRGKALSEKQILSEKQTTIIRKANASLSERIPTINNTTKNNITKKNIIKKSFCMNEIDFENFWKNYPIKKSKKKAWEIFKKIKEEKLSKILEAIENQKKEKEILINSGKFAPEWKHPTTWLNQECWNDETAIVSQDDEKNKNIRSAEEDFNLLIQGAESD